METGLMQIALFATAGLLCGLAIAALVFFTMRRNSTAAAQTTAEQVAAAALADQRLVELGAYVRAMGETIGTRQSELARHVNERLDAVTHRLGESMQTTAKHTAEHLGKLHERLAVIDHAQKNITDLASQVTSLQSVLSNKQTRGAFGQGRMEAIIQDSLPKSSYAFQHTLTNGKRPDCVVFLPDQRPLVIDAKFPLESVTALRAAATDQAREVAARQVRQDVMKHVNDIASRYLIAGETQDIALMFVPSESVYAELHDGFDDVVQKAYRLQVMLVSPTLLMLAVQVIQQIQKDARMREAADQIHGEVGHLMDDIGRLGDRVRKLQQHFNQSSEDVRQVLVSLDKIEKRGDRIRQVEFNEEDAPSPASAAAPVFKLQAGE
jgi:DNA recombination protein RmuC